MARPSPTTATEPAELELTCTAIAGTSPYPQTESWCRVSSSHETDGSTPCMIGIIVGMVGWEMRHGRYSRRWGHSRCVKGWSVSTGETGGRIKQVMG